MSGLKESVYGLKVVFNSSVLGSNPGRDTLASIFLMKKAMEENPKLTEQMTKEEMDSLPGEVEKGTTCFHRDDAGNPLLYTYVVKGALKDAASTLNGISTGRTVTKKKEEIVEKVSNFLSHVDQTVIVTPRKIPIITDKPIGYLERPMRGEGPKGPRVFLLRSEVIEEGASFECQIHCLETPKFTLSEDLLRTLLDYSSLYKGFGQWRNSGMYGKYDYTLTKIK